MTGVAVTAQEVGAATCHALSVAPMMDWTDRHFRYLVRLISGRVLLYTEMVNMNAVLFGDPDRHLAFSANEHPVALQLGGDDPERLAQCAAIAQQWGYDEVNLNVGCPSERVQSGNFGACLMAEPELVRECLAAMRSRVEIPVTVKHRIGIDDRDAYADLARFVAVVAQAKPARFTVHARKAWLKGLSPRENREIPPLRYRDVYRLKREFPELTVELNGGVANLAEAAGHLQYVDAVMLGRAVYADPFVLAGADAMLHGHELSGPSRREVVEGMLPYIEERLQEGSRLNAVTRHMLGLFNGCPGAKAWRRELSERAHLPGSGPDVVTSALARLPAAVLEERPGADCRLSNGLLVA